MSQEAPALAGSQATVSLGDVLACVAERLQTRFTALVHDLPLQTAENRPTPLLQFLHDARQQLLRAAALVHDTRKLPPLTQLVQPGGVLDIAATHARALQTTADELFGANDSLRWARVQLFNVPDALDVLSTGTYSSLPAAIHDMRGPMPAQEPEQQRLLNQLNHLLYAHLLKAHLPEALQLVEVTGGYAVLRCPGLYEVQLSLQQLPYPVQVAEARQAAKEAAVAAAAAGAAQDAEQKGTQQQGQEPGQQQQQQEPSAAAGADASAKPEVRWQWKLTHLVVLPNAGNRQPLQPEQRASLTFHLQQNMWAAADAAAVEAAKREGAAGGGQPLPAAGAAGKGEHSNPATAAAASQPAMSGMVSTRSGPAASTLSGVSGAQDVAGRGLQLDLYGADEISLPLRLMHAVLRDVAARILLREVETVASQLAAAGSKWHTHLKPRPAEKLKPGVCLLYWQQAPALLSMPDAAAEAAAEAAAGQAGHTAGGTAERTAAAAAGGGADRALGAAASKLGQPGKAAEAYPGIEVGTGTDGTIQQLHVPPLQLPSLQQQQQLQPVLDTHTVDIVGLLLQGLQVIVANQLHYLQAAIQQRQQQEAAASKEQQGPDGILQLRLCRYGHLASSAQRQQQQSQLTPRPQQAAAGVTAGLSYLGEEQQQQQQLLQQLPDTLEVWVEGQAAVTVSFQPWSGRLILRPGSAYGGDCNIDMGMSLHQHQEVLRSRQDRLFQQLQQQLLARSSGTVTVEQHQQAVVLPCLRDLASGLSDLCDELVLKQRYTNLVTAARMLSLQHSHHLRGFLLAGQQLRLTQAAGAAGKARTARSLRQIYLSMPSLQLPPYMLLLARGAWCGAAADLQQQQLGQQEQQPTGAAASGRLVPAQLAMLNPVLCMSFPRQQTGNADGLLLVLNNTQGLAGPLLKELRLPSQQQAVVDAFPTSAVDGVVGSGGARKRQRDEFEAPPQQQQQQQPQTQSPPRQVDCLQQLTAAVEYSRARLTYERLCLELTALQVSFVEVRLPTAAVSQGSGAVNLQEQQQQQQQAWRAPCIQVLSVPGVQLFQQLQRPCGCSPAAVGLHEVWIGCGPEPGQWCVELSGSVYHQQQQLGAAEGGPLWRWQYDFAAGDDVRTAVLQLQRLLYMQQFMNRLEALACGQQQLTVLQCSSTAAGKAAMAAAAGEAGIEIDRPIKKARRSNSELEKQQQQQSLPDGLGAGLDNGPSSGLPLNGMLQQQQQQQQQPPDSNGQLGPLSNGLRISAGANGHAVGKSAGGSSSGGSSAYGLLWHWPGTGLVRLAWYSCFEAVLQCSKPLDDPQAAAATAATAGGVQGSSGLQQQQLPPSRVEFHVCWQPKYEFGAKPRSVQPSVGPWGVAQGAAVGDSRAGIGSGKRRWPSSSNSTTWLDVHSTQRPQQQQQRQAGGAGGSSAPPEAVSAEDVLDMGCCISCSSSNVPDVLLSELASMADAGCEDLLLDAVAMLGWPLSQMQQLLSDLDLARVGTLLARAAKKAADTAAAAGAAAGGSSSAAAAAATAAAAAGGSGWWPSVVSSCPTGSWQQLRVTVGAEAAEPLTIPQQQQQKAEQQQGEGSRAREGPRLKCELLLDVCVVSGGRVKLTVRHLDTAGGRPWQAAITAMKPQAEGSAAAAAAAAAVPEAAAQYASKVVVTALQHLQKTQPKVCCRPTFGATTWQRRIVPQFDKTPPPAAAGAAEGHAGRREPLSGLYLLVQDLQPVLTCLFEVWTYHVFRTAATAAATAEKARSAAAAATAAAAAAAASSEAGQTTGTAASAAVPPAGQQPQQQQQQQQAGQEGSGQQQGQVQVKPEQQQQAAQGQVMQPHQQAALQQAAAKALAQQQQQQQVRPQMPQVSQAQTATMYAASAAPTAAAAGTVQAMTLQVPGSMPMAAAGVPRPVAVVPMPQQQPQVLLSMPGMQYQMMPGGAAMMGVQPTAWAVMQGVPQQQHPAQQQQQHH